MSISGGAKLRPKLSAILLAGVLINLTACSGISLSSPIFPGPVFASNFPPPGPKNYQDGMVDGCQTAINATSLGKPYGAVHSGYKFDINRGLYDQTYHKVWRDGFAYCKHEHAYYQG